MAQVIVESGSQVDGRITIRVFGGFTLRTAEGASVALSRRASTMMAALLMARGAATSTDALVALVWGDEVPRTARNQLHRLVSQTRRLLEPDLSAPGIGSVILGAGDGYRISVADLDCDLYRFDATTEEARAHAAQGRQPESVRTYIEALELARRPAFSGLERQLLLHPDFVALERERARTASEALATSMTGEVIPRLLTLAEDVAAEAPFDEVLQARLVRTLGRVGRRSDALTLLQITREKLRDELGLDPGLDLQLAQDEVLRLGDETVHTAADVVVATTHVPAQLPANAPGMLRRRDAQGYLDELASAGDASTVLITAIAGMGGIGKTTLAVQWAHEVAHRFPDGQLYINLRGFDAGGRAVPPTEALATLLSSMGIVPESAEAGVEAVRSAQYRTAVSGKRMLILLDNARDAEQIRPLLPGTAGCLVIVTSRNRLASLVIHEGAVPIQLDRMTDRESREVLRSRLGRRVDAEPAAADRLVSLCAGLPLALSIAAARLVLHPGLRLDEVADRLEPSTELVGRGLAGWASDESKDDIRSVFAWSVESLSSAAARQFRLLAVHPGQQMSLIALSAIADIEMHEARTIVDELLLAHLIDEPRAGLFVIHDLLHVYANELAADDAERVDAERRLISHFVASTRAAWNQFGRDPVGELDQLASVTPAVTFATSEAAIVWFRQERDVLISVLHLAHAKGYLRACANIVCDWRPMTAIVDSARENLEHERVGLAAAVGLGDHLLEAELSRTMAGKYFHIDGRAEGDVLLERARFLFESLGDLPGQSSVLRNRAMVLTFRGANEEAVVAAEAATDLARRAGRADLITVCQLTLGWSLQHAKRTVEALAVLRDAQLAVDENGLTHWEMLTRQEIMVVLLADEDYEEVVGEGLRGVASSAGVDLRADASVFAMTALAATRTGQEDVVRESCRRFHDVVDSYSADELRYMSGPDGDFPGYVVRAEQWLAEHA